jgi:hypothetical protein
MYIGVASISDVVNSENNEKCCRMFCIEYGVQHDDVCEVHPIFTRYVFRFIQYMIVNIY